MFIEVLDAMFLSFQTWNEVNIYIQLGSFHDSVYNLESGFNYIASMEHQDYQNKKKKKLILSRGFYRSIVGPALECII